MSSYYRTLLMEQVIDGAYYVNLIIAYANSQGWTIPSTGTINAMIVLVDSMLSSGIWNKYDIFYNFGYNDINLQNFSRINWKNPGLYTITIVHTTTYDTQGFSNTFIGTTLPFDMRLDTNFIPSTNGVEYTLNDASVIAFYQMEYNAAPQEVFKDNSVNNGDYTYRGGQFSSSKIGSVTAKYISVNGGVINTSTPFYSNDSLSLYSHNRTSASNVDYYKDGSLVSSNISTSSNLPSNSIKVMGYDATSIFSLFSMGSSLNSTDNTNLYTYITSFRTTIGL